MNDYGASMALGVGTACGGTSHRQGSSPCGSIHRCGSAATGRRGRRDSSERRATHHPDARVSILWEGEPCK